MDLTSSVKERLEEVVKKSLQELNMLVSSEEFFEGITDEELDNTRLKLDYMQVLSHKLQILDNINNSINSLKILKELDDFLNQ